MQCLHPFKKRLKSGEELYLPCGKCINCRINKRREWTTRLLHETYLSESAYFVTLTYDEQSLPYNNYGNMAVCKDDIQKFFKRLRKHYPDNNIRYFCGSEYGDDTGRPHYHLIIFNLPDDVLKPSIHYIKGMPLTKTINGFISLINRKLSDIWGLGFTTIGQVCKERASYCAKYFVDRKTLDPVMTPNFNLMSRKPGIGYEYSQNIKSKVRTYNINSCFTEYGTYVILPRYYRQKIYSEEELKEHYIDKIDEINKKYLDFSQSINNDVELVTENINKQLHFKNIKSKI